MNKISSQDVSLFLEKLAAPKGYYDINKPAPVGSNFGDNKEQQIASDELFNSDRKLQHTRTAAKNKEVSLVTEKPGVVTPPEQRTGPLEPPRAQAASSSGSNSKSIIQPAKLKFW